MFLVLVVRVRVGRARFTTTLVLLPLVLLPRLATASRNMLDLANL